MYCNVVYLVLTNCEYEKGGLLSPFKIKPFILLKSKFKTISILHMIFLVICMSKELNKNDKQFG